jgi:hypothetical protein
MRGRHVTSKFLPRLEMTTGTAAHHESLIHGALIQARDTARPAFLPRRQIPRAALR